MPSSTASHSAIPQASRSKDCNEPNLRYEVKYSVSDRSDRANSRREEICLLNDDSADDGDEDDETHPLSRLNRSRVRHPIEDGAVIEIDDLDDGDMNHEGNVLRVADAYQETFRKSVSSTQDKERKKSLQLKSPLRNPPITGLLTKVNIYRHGIFDIKAGVTIETRRGSFARIKDIVANRSTKAITIRAHRLLRVKDFNGCLDKKMNELVLFTEVDMDDARPALEQTVIEISVQDIKCVRGARITNQKFPLDRNVDTRCFRNKDQVYQEGGLTLRWRYTGTYVSASYREKNEFKERALERFREDECTSVFALSDDACRFQWRGETIPGGAFIPGQESNESIILPDSPVLQSVSNSNARSQMRRVSTLRTANMQNGDGKTQRREARPPKRRISKLSLGEPEHARKRLAKMSLEEPHGRSRDMSGVIDLTSDFEIAHEPPIQPRIADHAPQRRFSRTPSIPQIVDLTSSDLADPPLQGSIRQSFSPVPPLVVRKAGQMLTYGDAFCGAGGSTRGAVMAGLKVKWGFDFNEHACETWRSNFPNAKIYHMAAHDFITSARQAELHGNKDLMKVDILHLSPPCQYFSPAHTINGVDDEMNVASLFAVEGVIEVSKPRIVTLEQTFGIMTSARFRPYFNTLIRMFTTHNFSVRWAIIPLVQWGLPQRRNRVIIIASCPGEKLPRMPPATHSDPADPIPGTRPYVSVDETIEAIPHNALDHNIEAVQFTSGRHNVAYDGGKFLPRAMTTHGGQNYHPSGERDLTLREYASLQGFPVAHQFKGSYLKKQIGNAVPPVIAKVLFESVKKDLDRSDGILESPELIE